MVAAAEELTDADLAVFRHAAGKEHRHLSRPRIDPLTATGRSRCVHRLKRQAVMFCGSALN
jgi:hypothetical protein